MDNKLSKSRSTVSNTITEYIILWEGRCYPDGIPDEVPSGVSDKVPNYKSICACIIRNDLHFESLGMSKPKCRAYSEIKRAELIERGVIKQDYQTKLI